MEIFLLRLDRIGDFILGIPAYRALRRARPRDRISVMVPSAVAELAKACPYFDEVYVFEALWLVPDQGPWDRWKSAWKLVRFLRSRDIDWLLDFRYQNRLDPLVAGLSGAAMRAGFDLGPWSFFLNVRVPRPADGTHQIQRNLSLLKGLGIAPEGMDLEMWWDERDLKHAEDRLPSQQALPGLPKVAVHLGAAVPSKRWGADSFEVLIHELHAATQADILVLGGEQDLAFSQDVLDGLECPVINLVGKLTLGQMAALMAQCSLFIGCDSGPSHLAAACGVPVVSLFSAANEAEVWKPWGSRVRVITRHPDCSPCRSAECLRKDGYFCMDEIPPEEALEAAKALLASR